MKIDLRNLSNNFYYFGYFKDKYRIFKITRHIKKKELEIDCILLSEIIENDYINHMMINDQYEVDILEKLDKNINFKSYKRIILKLKSKYPEYFI